MIGGGKVLGLVTARGRSKRIPRKNLQVLGGRPLIAWTIAAGKGSRYIDRLVVSTEDREIADVARSFGADVPFTRPEALATDDSPGIDPVLHALAALPGHQWIVLLQPTSPLRQAADIDACLELCERSAAPACVSVAPPHCNPYWMFRLDAKGRIEPLAGWTHADSPRQDQPPAYSLNGAVYVARADWLQRQRTFLSAETLAYVMPRERSVDIDTDEDLKLARLIAEGAHQ